MTALPADLPATTRSSQPERESLISDVATLPRITVVVCTYNRAAQLGDALRSLLTLETAGEFAYELLVVDNNSTDHTQQVVQSFAKESPVPLRSVIETERGVVAARNRGLRDANGEWIAFFDDDQLADPRWLQELLRTAQERECLCVGGAVALQLPAECERNLAPICRMLLSETVDMQDVRPYDRRTTPGTGNVMIHRLAIERVGQFNRAMLDRAEDTELFLRMLDAGLAAWYTPRAIIHHVIPADRLNDDYFLAIANKMGKNLATLERDAWGAWLFPGRWLLRAIHAYAWFWPQSLWAYLRGEPEAILGSKCRLELSNSYLARGWQIMTGRG